MRTRITDDVDAFEAEAEFKLNQLEQRTSEAVPDTPQPVTILGDSIVGHVGMHLINGDGDMALPDRDEPASGQDGGLEYAIDSFAQAFNSHDLEAILECLCEDVETPGLGNDRDNLPAFLEDVWGRRPTLTLQRGILNERPVGVFWEVGDDERWWLVAPLMCELAEDGRISVMELADSPDAVDSVSAEEPDREFLEGDRWQTWQDGVQD